MARNLTGLPVVLADTDQVVLTGGLGIPRSGVRIPGAECLQVRPFNSPEKISLWTHHECDDHDVVVVWPNVMYAGICNCGPMSNPHPVTQECPTERRMR